MLFSFLSRQFPLRSAHSAARIESLEGRRLLSASAIATDVLELTPTDPIKVESVVVPLSVTLVKIEGTYNGHYNGHHVGKGTLQFDITHFTHTGHFKGEVFVRNSSGSINTTITSGVIHSNRHVDITASNPALSVSFVGIASHTGGSFSGTFTATGAVNDTGTFNAAKS
jgi:hypothetical protein